MTTSQSTGVVGNSCQARLLSEGRTPSMSEVAEAAQVTRRTVYLHFPTLDQLLIDATLGALSQNAVDEAIDAADTGGDVDAGSTR
jgi:AcrR family transcriptional regulator